MVIGAYFMVAVSLMGTDDENEDEEEDRVVERTVRISPGRGRLI